MTYLIKDPLFAMAACFTCWFRKNSVLERRLDFLDDACSKERKEELPYRLLIWVYRKKIERGYPYRRLYPHEFLCGTRCQMRSIGEYDNEICSPKGYDGKHDLTDDQGWFWVKHTINPATMDFIEMVGRVGFFRIKNKIWHKTLRF